MKKRIVVDQWIKELILSEWVGSETTQKRVQWLTYLLSFLMISNILTFSFSWIMQRLTLISTDWLVLTWLILEGLLAFGFLVQTPWLKFLLEEKKLLRWD